MRGLEAFTAKLIINSKPSPVIEPAFMWSLVENGKVNFILTPFATEPAREVEAIGPYTFIRDIFQCADPGRARLKVGLCNNPVNYSLSVLCKHNTCGIIVYNYDAVFKLESDAAVIQAIRGNLEVIRLIVHAEILFKHSCIKV